MTLLVRGFPQSQGGQDDLVSEGIPPDHREVKMTLLVRGSPQSQIGQDDLVSEGIPQSQRTVTFKTVEYFYTPLNS